MSDAIVQPLQPRTGPLLSPDHASLVALQRAAGNRATAIALGQTPIVQRLVWWDDKVNPATVASITLDRLSGSGGGAHTTAHQLFIETVQNAVINADYAKAIRRVKALAADVQDLPGWSGTPAQQNLLQVFTDSYKHAEGAKNSIANHSASLENLCIDYVRLRNSLDYTYHKGGEGGIGGFREKTWLKEASAAHTAVNFKNIATDLKKGKQTKNLGNFEKFIEASANLLDTRNINRPPGVGKAAKAWVDRWTKTIRQHIATIIVAHPGSDAAADIIIEHLTDLLGRDVGLSVSEMNALKTAMQGNTSGWKNIDKVG